MTDKEQKDSETQLEINFNYLFLKMNQIHDIVCPNEIGSWQDKPIQIIKALNKAKTDYITGAKIDKA